MTNAIELYNAEINKLDDRIRELKGGNSEDEKRLQVAEDLYEKAVNNFESEKADELHNEITDIKRNMDNRNRQIGILSNPNNPVRKQAKSVYRESLEKEREVIKQKADTLHDEIMKARQAYLALATKAPEMNRAYQNADRAALKASGATGYGNQFYLNFHQYKVEIGDITPQGGDRE